jgi:hypothetical protein
LKEEEGVCERGDDGIDNGTGDEGEVEEEGFVVVEEKRGLFVRTNCVDGEVNDDDTLLKEEGLVFE